MERPLQKEKESEGIFWGRFGGFKNILYDSLINNLETIKILKTEQAIEVFEQRLLVKSMHKKVIKGTDSGCLDNQYRWRP